MEGTPYQSECLIMFYREETPTTITTMKTIRNLLPALALVFGATLAMAMNFASPTTANDPKYGWHEGEVYDVTNRSMGSGALQYQCNIDTDPCLFQDAEVTTPISGSQGEFVPGSGLTPIED